MKVKVYHKWSIWVALLEKGLNYPKIKSILQLSLLIGNCQDRDIVLKKVLKKNLASKRALSKARFIKDLKVTKIHLSELPVKINSNFHHNKELNLTTINQTESSGISTNKTYHFSKDFIHKSLKKFLPHKKSNVNLSIA